QRVADVAVGARQEPRLVRGERPRLGPGNGLRLVERLRDLETRVFGSDVPFHTLPPLQFGEEEQLVGMERPVGDFRIACMDRPAPPGERAGPAGRARGGGGGSRPPPARGALAGPGGAGGPSPPADRPSTGSGGSVAPGPAAGPRPVWEG